MKRAIVIFLLVWQVSLSGFAQQDNPKPNVVPAQPEAQQPGKQNEDEVVRITTNLVQVDPVITDRNGKIVTDLQPEEVQILEDGRPQKITNFSYVPLESVEAPAPAPRGNPKDKNSPPVPPVRLRPEQVRRTMALVVDDIGLSFESAHFVRDALKKFLDQQMQPNDLVAIIRTGGGMGALQQFTSDKRQLYMAAEKVRWKPNGRGGMAAFSPMASDPVSNMNRPGANDGSVDAAKEDLNQFREDVFTVGTLGAVNYVVKGLRTLPGRKSVVLFSDGFHIFSENDPHGNTRVIDAMANLIELANRASVVIYTIDARGLQPLNFTAADSGSRPDQSANALQIARGAFHESQNGMALLSRNTGGLALMNNNDLIGALKRAMADQKGYYLIGYRPDESTFDKVSGRRKFHHLTLKINRPGKFNVRMRNGFFGVADSDAVPVKLTRNEQMIGALTSPFGAEGVHLRLTSLFANDAKTGSAMRSLLHVNARDLTFTEQPDGWHQAVFDILAVTFGDNGMIVDQLGRTHTLGLKGKSYERVLKDGFTYNINVPIKKAGAYQLRTALRDVASEHVGSANQFIEVPDIKKNRLTLSGIMMRGLPLQVFEKGGVDVGEEKADDTVDETDPTTSAAVRQLKTGLVVVYGLAIYNARIDKATGKPAVQIQMKLFRNGQEVFTGKETPLDVSNQTDLKRLSAGGAMQLGSEMAPGEYILQVLVTDSLAKENYRVASQWIDFEVLK
jgi:VWFA-related protein